MSMKVPDERTRGPSGARGEGSIRLRVGAELPLDQSRLRDGHGDFGWVIGARTTLAPVVKADSQASAVLGAPPGLHPTGRPGPRSLLHGEPTVVVEACLVDRERVAADLAVKSANAGPDPGRVEHSAEYSIGHGPEDK